MKSMNMDTLAPKHSSSSSGCSTASSTTDIKTPKKAARDSSKASGHSAAASRSRSFLYCISKHLGRHFLHHHRRHHDNMYNSQEDVRSSSTDSFSLSFERNSLQKSAGGGGGSAHIASSSIDLTTTSGERTSNNSRTSSVSPCSRFSPALFPLDVDVDVDGLYRPTSALDHHGDFSTSEEDDDADSEYDCERGSVQMCGLAVPSASETVSPTPTGSKSGGLHLSRISISSSVSRMLHHLSATASTRSLSCSSTPLRCFKDSNLRLKSRKANNATAGTTKALITSSKSAPASSTATANSTGGSSSKKKAKKQQQSILRPPIHYVYTKGMSGLYSRVPRYTVCCPYAMQQFA